METNQIYNLLKQQDEDGKTALHWAAKWGDTEAIQKILEILPIDGKEEFICKKYKAKGLTALHIASFHGKIKAVKELLKACPKTSEGYSDSLFDILNPFFKNRHDEYNILFIQEKDGKTALHWAVLGENTEVVEELLKTCNKNVLYQFLIAQDKNGKTALHWAAYKRNEKIIKQLLAFCTGDKSNFISTKDNDHNTAINYVPDNEEEIKSLLEQQQPLSKKT